MKLQHHVLELDGLDPAIDASLYQAKVSEVPGKNLQFIRMRGEGITIWFF